MPKISKEGKKILLKWQDMGVRFYVKGFTIGVGRQSMVFDGAPSHYEILEQPVPEKFDSEELIKAVEYGLLLQATTLNSSTIYNINSIIYTIKAQPIPKELLEMDEPKQEDAEAWRAEYRRKQASGIKFEMYIKNDDAWEEMHCYFNLSKDMYREVKEESKLEPLIHHPKERMLWLQQRIAGTNEQWQHKFSAKENWKWHDLPIGKEPADVEV